MSLKVFIALLLVVSCSLAREAHNNRKWPYIHRRVYMSPNPKAGINHKDIFIPRRSYSTGTIKVDNCGVPQVADSKIVGGTEATPHSFPWQVALFLDNTYFCGGSVISDEWILTAGHCLDEISRARVVLGAHNLDENEASQQTMYSTDLTVHEDYSALRIKNDIALVHLPTKINFNRYIQPVCLPSKRDQNLPVGTEVTPTGWGLTSDSSHSISDTLQQVTVPVISQIKCQNVYGSGIDERNICTDGAGGHGTCNGDSGGPLNWKNGGKWYTRGIVSFGSSAGCEKGYPDAFTRVSYDAFLDWISEKTGIYTG